jgi:hypothetical protein
MSFNGDPYRAMTVVRLPDGTWHYECDSCGGGWRLTLQPDVTVAEVWRFWTIHVQNSHKLTPEDTAGWSS